MAAGALTEVLAAPRRKWRTAADEIGIEHNLGLTCDPIGGLVQVPCIERNAVASVTAINAARLALRGDGSHFVSLDRPSPPCVPPGATCTTSTRDFAWRLAVNVIEWLARGRV